MLLRLWREDEGVLTFEWILLLTLLVIGVIGGVAGIRDALLAECQNVVGAIASVNQTYTVAPPLGVSVSNGAGVAACSGAQGFGFTGGNGYNVFRQSVTTTADLGSASCGL